MNLSAVEATKLLFYYRYKALALQASAHTYPVRCVSHTEDLLCRDPET